MNSKPGVVFDTGVVLQAGLRSAGPAGRLLALLSEELIAEYEDVLTRPSIRAKNPRLTEELAAAIVERIRGCASLALAVPHRFGYIRGPDDEHVINLAIEADAQYLISRDKDLLDLMDENSREGQAFRQSFPGLTVLDPVAALQRILPRADNG